MAFQVRETFTQPSTPETGKSENIDENTSLAVTLIQQTIRGRSEQNKMIEGKVKYRELISEVKATLLIDNASDEKMKEHMKDLTGVLQASRTDNEHKDSTVNQILEELEGRSVGECLDFLSKELVRLEEDRRIHAFAIICERQRRKREIAEGRMRMDETRRRAEEDEILKEVLKTHQCSVDGYLEQIISTTLDQVADDQSKREIETHADSINKLAYHMEKYRDQIMSEEIAADLVHSFLIPEANKEFIRTKVRRNQRRFLMAAHGEIYDTYSPFFKHDREDNSSSFSEYDREEDKTPRLSDHDSEEGKTPPSSKHEGEEGKTPRSSKHEGEEGKTPRSSKHEGEEGKTRRSSKHEGEEGKTLRISKHGKQKDKTPRIFKHAREEDKTLRISKNEGEEGKTPRSSKHDREQHKTARSSKNDGEEDKTLRMSKHGGEEDPTLRISKHGRKEYKTLRLSKHVKKFEKTLRSSTHGREEDKTLRSSKHDREEHKTTRSPKHDGEADKTLRISKHGRKVDKTRRFFERDREEDKST